MGRHRKAKTVAVIAAPRDARPVLKQLLGYRRRCHCVLFFLRVNMACACHWATYHFCVNQQGARVSLGHLRQALHDLSNLVGGLRTVVLD